MNQSRLSFLAAALLLVFSASGCSLCCSPYADDYVAFGSRTPRMDMKHGRVGSIFSDPQLMGTTTHAESSSEIPYVQEFEDSDPQGEIILEGAEISLGPE
jgi:hypothetical protein